jgi:hypothetical protein
MLNRRFMVAMWLVAVAATVALCGASLLLGDLNHDEGWYLYAATNVSEGLLPYVDFAYTQGPVLPFAYVPAVPLVRALGLAGGRLYTTVLGLVCAALAARLAARVASPPARAPAALMVFCFVGVNVYHAYFCTVVKTYALTALLLVGGFSALASASGRRAYTHAFLSGVLLMLAAGTRSSAGFVIPVVFLYVLVNFYGRGRAAPPPGGHLPAPPCPWLFAAGAVGTALALFAPFFIKAPQGMWFALVEYHAGRDAGGLLPTLAYKAGFAARLTHAYTAAALSFLAVAAHLLLRNDRARPSTLTPHSRLVVGSLWLGVLAVSAVHFLAPFPYDDYQVIVYPLFAVALSVLLAELAFSRRVDGVVAPASPAGRWVVPAVFLATLAAALASPVAQSWFVGQRDRIWWPLKEESPLTRLRRVARFVREEAGDGAVLLTQDTYLAVEAGLRVPAGMELGPFCYFPDWEGNKAAACRVLNREQFLALLDSAPATVAAFSGYGLSIRSPGVRPLAAEETGELWDALLARYAVTREVEAFGQAETTLKILRRRKEGQSP